MTWKRIRDHLRKGTAAVLAVFVLSAAEHKGEVKFGGLPVPGATVTATQGGKKFAAVTDQQGSYFFRDLPDGAWTLHRRRHAVLFGCRAAGGLSAPGAPASRVGISKLLPLDEILKAAGWSGVRRGCWPAEQPVAALGQRSGCQRNRARSAKCQTWKRAAPERARRLSAHGRECVSVECRRRSGEAG